MNYKVVFLFIALLTISSCLEFGERIDDEYILGKWTHYGEQELDGITKSEDLTVISPIRYEFKADGKVDVGVEKNLTWKISDKQELLLFTGKDTAIYNGIVNSDTSLVLTRKFKDHIFLYYFKRGWSE